MAIQSVKSGLNLLPENVGSGTNMYPNGIRISVPQTHKINADISKWRILYDGTDITKYCQVYQIATYCCAVKMPSNYYNYNKVIINEGDYRRNIVIQAPVTELNTNTTVKAEIQLNLAKHLKAFLANVSTFNSSPEVVVPVISTLQSEDLKYYNVSENGRKVDMEIFDAVISDTPTIFSLYVPVCDSANITATPADFILDKENEIGVQTLMGKLKVAKAVRVLNDYETETNIVVLPADDSLIDVDGKRYMLVRFSFWHNIEKNPSGNNYLQYADEHKIYLVFEN